MSRTKAFFYNACTTALYQVFVFISGFIVPKIILQYYGSETNGLVSSITQFITYFNLVEAGLSGAVVYSLYKPLAERNMENINGILSAARKFYNQAGVIFTILTISFSFVYPLFVDTAFSSGEVSVLVLVLGVSGALEFFTLAKYRALLTADQKTYVISLASSIHIIVNTFVSVLCAKIGLNIIYLKVFALTSVFLRSIILYVYTHVKYQYLDYSVKPRNEALNKRWDALYLQILGVIHNGAPIICLTLILRDLKIVSVYTIYNIVFAGINSILSVFTNGLSASFGDLIIRKEKNKLQEVYSDFEHLYYILLSAIYSVTFLMILPFIRLYTKDIKDAVYILPLAAILFTLNGLLFNLKTPQGMLVISAGMYRETRRQTTIQGAIVVCLGLFLTRYWNIYGVLTAAIISNIYRDIDLLFFIPKYVTHLSYKNTLTRWRNLLVASTITISPFLFFNYTERIINYKSWIVFSVLSMCYALVVNLAISIITERESLKRLLCRAKILR